MHITNEVAEFSSGKRLSIERGIIGINNQFEIFEGYDSNIELLDEMPVCDKIELADYMINMWSTFRDSLMPNKELC